MTAYLDVPLEQVPGGQYRVILADPPWKFSSGPNKNPSRHYPTMPLRDIAALDVGRLAHPEGCRLFLWITPPIAHLRFGPREVFTAWGFKYSTKRVWVKLWPREAGGAFIYHDSQARGPGFETTGDSEDLLIAKRGRPEPIIGAKPRGAFFAPRTKNHSEKPADLRAELTRLFQGPRIELFARSTAEGWDAWGNQVGRLDQPRVAA